MTLVLTFYAVNLLTLGVKNWAQLLTIYNYIKINFEIGHFMHLLSVFMTHFHGSRN
jgi:hypothetical protein